MHPLRFLRTHKTAEEKIAEGIAVGVSVGLARQLLRYAGVGLGAAVASAAVTTGWIDLSNNNGSHATVAIAAPGVRVVEAKATEGVHFQDSLYPTFRAAAARSHRAFGGYLFLHPDVSGAVQARYLLAYATPKAGDIQPVVDSETGPPATAAKATYAALHELTLHGFQPILYASSSYVLGLVRADPRIKQFRVWQAEYGPTLHLVPGVHVIAWQFTDRALVGGIAVDGSQLLVRRVASLEIKPVKTVPACGVDWPRRPRSFYVKAAHAAACRH